MRSWRHLKVQVEENETPPAIIYRVSGMLTDTSDAFALLDQIREGLEGETPLHIIDLGGVPHVTSAGIGILAAAYTSAQRTGRRVVVAAPADRVESMLKVVGLWSLMEHFDSVEAALKS